MLLSTIFQLYHGDQFSGGGSRSTRREPPTMGKQLVNFITCGCESSAPFFVIYLFCCRVVGVSGRDYYYVCVATGRNYLLFQTAWVHSHSIEISCRSSLFARCVFCVLCVLFLVCFSNVSLVCIMSLDVEFGLHLWSICRYVNVSMCRYVYVSICLCVDLSMCQCVDCQCVDMSMCRFVNVSMCRYVYVSICQCVYNSSKWIDMYMSYHLI